MKRNKDKFGGFVVFLNIMALSQNSDPGLVCQEPRHSAADTVWSPQTAYPQSGHPGLSASTSGQMTDTGTYAVGLYGH